MFKRGFKSWCENLALQLRKRVGIKNVDPFDPRHLAEVLEVSVWVPEQIPGLGQSDLHVLLKKDSANWSAVTLRLDSGDLVIMNSSHSVVRQSSSLMHELSHLLLEHKPARAFFADSGLLMLDTYDKHQEDEANWLAGCLLVPREALLHIAWQGVSPSHAARKYGISHDMLNYRIRVTGVEKQVNHAARAKAPNRR